MLDDQNIYDSCEPLIKLVEGTNPKQWTQGAVHRTETTSCFLGHIQRAELKQGEITELNDDAAYTSIYGKRADELFKKFNKEVLSTSDYCSIPHVNDTHFFSVPGTNLTISDNPRANILSILYTMRAHDMANFMGELEQMATKCEFPQVTLDDLLERPVSVSGSSAVCEADLQPLDLVQVEADLTPEQMFHVEQNR